MTTVTPTQQGSQVTSITVMPLGNASGGGTLMQLTVTYDTGNSQSATFAVPTGPQGIRGSNIRTGKGTPPVTPDCIVGDLYLDLLLGHIWYFDGTNWDDTNEILMPDTLAPDALVEVDVTQNGSTTTNTYGRTTNPIINVTASQYQGVGNPIVSVTAVKGPAMDAWREAELARAGVMTSQMALINTMRRQQMILNAQRAALERAITTTTRLGTVTVQGL